MLVVNVFTYELRSAELLATERAHVLVLADLLAIVLHKLLDSRASTGQGEMLPNTKNYS